LNRGHVSDLWDCQQAGQAEYEYESNDHRAPRGRERSRN
jgi:hypothetical protein